MATGYWVAAAKSKSQQVRQEERREKRGQISGDRAEKNEDDVSK
jgi:hypothetical protein